MNGTTWDRTCLEDRPIFRSDLVTIGIFRAGVEHPSFHDTGPATAHLFVFPRTAVRIEHEGKGSFMADPSIVTFYNAGQAYRRHPVDVRGDICEWFAVRRDAIAEVLKARHPDAPGFGDTLFTFARGPSDPVTYAVQRQLCRHVLHGRSVDTLAVEEKVMEILGAVVARACPPESAADAAEEGDQRPLVEAVRHLLVKDFRSPKTLDDIAGEVGASVFHLCRVFKRQTGTTIHQFRHQLRLRHSLELVAEAGSDLSRIALHLGFSSHSHFTAAFRRAFHITPSEFRRFPSARRLNAAALVVQGGGA